MLQSGMAIKEILKLPHPVLRVKSHKIHRQSKAYVAQIIMDLMDTATEHGAAGLAAPQIGVPLRIIVVRAGDRYFRMINPEITLAAGRSVGDEGCLSLPPDFIVPVVRASRINWKDAAGRGKATGLLARIIQHEIDHLNAVLIIDKVEMNAPQETDEDMEEVGTDSGLL